MDDTSPEAIAALVAEIRAGDLTRISATADALEALARERDEARAETADTQRVFDLEYAADQRAIARWQEATGRASVWPDRTNLVLWLMQYVDLADALNSQISTDLAAERERCARIAENVADYPGACAAIAAAIRGETE